jgi:hypothetical protein
MNTLHPQGRRSACCSSPEEVPHDVVMVEGGVAEAKPKREERLAITVHVCVNARWIGVIVVGQ